MAGRAHVYSGRWQAVQMFTGVDGRQAMHCTYVYRGRWQAEHMFTGVDGRQSTC